MKIAYLVSLYPAVSHTFILNEIRALRRIGVQIGTFSIRKPLASDILGPEAQAEALRTRSILPTRAPLVLRSLLWCLRSNPAALARTLLDDVLSGEGAKEKARWLAYTLEGIILARWLREEGFEHLHCHFGNSASSSAMIAAKLARLTYSVSCHGSELNEPRRFRLADKLKSAAFMACVSKFGRARLMLVSPREDWDKLRVVRCGAPGLATEETRHGIGDTSIAGDTSSAGDAGDETGAGILCVGRLSQEKGHHVLLDAFDTVLASRPDASLTIVGDGPLRKELEARAKELKTPSALQFTGSLPPHEVANLYRRCSVVALASFSEGVPLVLMEAFSHTKPVVATWVGGIPELVEHQTNGLLVAPGDAAGLAGAILELLADPAKARRFGLHGAAKVAAEFDQERSAEMLKSLYTAAIEASGSAITEPGRTQSHA